MAGYFEWLRWLLLAASAALIFAGCDWVPRSKTVTTGTYEGLQIGASKEEVVNWLQAQGHPTGVTVHLVDPPRATSTDGLDSLAFATAIRATGRAFAVNLHFERDEVVRAIISPMLRDRFGSYFEVGTSREQAITGIAMLMDEYTDVVAWEVIPSTIKRTVPVGEPGSILDEKLAKFDLWEIGYVRRDSFSVSVWFHFADGRLVKVEHFEDYGY